MNTTDFFVYPYPKDPLQDVICQNDGDIKLRVMNLTSHTPYYRLKEKRYFGDDHGDSLVFETIGYKDWPEEDILSAIRWYARYLDYPQMEITPEY